MSDSFDTIRNIVTGNFRCTSNERLLGVALLKLADENDSYRIRLAALEQAEGLAVRDLEVRTASLQAVFLALTGKERLAVVKLAEEVEPLAHRLRRVEEPEAGAAHPRRDAGGREDVLGEERGNRDRRVLGEAEAERPAGVDRAAEGDDRVDSARAAVGGDLVAEHPALRVAADVDPVVAGRLADQVDRLVERDHVVVERALEAALVQRTERDGLVEAAYRASPEVRERLERLLALERQCCPGARWDLREDGALLRMRISAT